MTKVFVDTAAWIALFDVLLEIKKYWDLDKICVIVAIHQLP
ncbi:MAG: hypothetical protein V7K89_20640 [Nostoc sp.]